MSQARPKAGGVSAAWTVLLPGAAHNVEIAAAGFEREQRHERLGADIVQAQAARGRHAQAKAAGNVRCFEVGFGQGRRGAGRDPDVRRRCLECGRAQCGAPAQLRSGASSGRAATRGRRAPSLGPARGSALD